jgi:predicted nucleic acid-binding protein
MIPRPLKTELAAVDAMIWIHNHDRESPYYSCCRKVRNLIAGGEFKGCIALQTATEIVGAVSNPRNYRPPKKYLGFPVALEMASDVLKTPNLRLILPQATSFSKAIDLCRKYNLKRKHWYDAALAATLLENGIHILYTMNEKDFLPITELSLINPFTETLRPGSIQGEWNIASTTIPKQTPDRPSSSNDDGKTS